MTPLGKLFWKHSTQIMTPNMVRSSSALLLPFVHKVTRDTIQVNSVLKAFVRVNLTPFLTYVYRQHTVQVAKMDKWSCGKYPNIDFHLSDRTSAKAEAVEVLIRVRCLHNVCSHTSLGGLGFSQIRIMCHQCPHVAISTDKAAQCTHR